MDHFNLKNGVLHAEDVPLSDIAEAVGTPVYVYSRATLERHFRVMDEAFGTRPQQFFRSPTSERSRSFLVHQALNCFRGTSMLTRVAVTTTCT